MKRIFILLLFFTGLTPVGAQNNGLWSDVQESGITPAGTRYIVPKIYRTIRLDLFQLNGILTQAPLEFTQEALAGASVITLPMPDGTYQGFKFWESPTMEPELQAKYPEIRTYTGQGIDDQYTTLKFDLTPIGFHAQILSPNGRIFIDPYSMGDRVNYISYYTRDYTKPDSHFDCVLMYHEGYHGYEGDTPLTPTGPQLRTYRLANAATGEYTAFFGGTVTNGLAAVVTSVNRVNGVYEKELAIRMVLVANNNLLIYTNASTDPYTNSNGSTMLGQNISNLSSVIGNANFDIGHVFSTGGGGVAYLGVICNNTYKAGGVTGSSAPVGDPYDIDYVAHEMGHQFGGSHTFNSVTSSCGGGNRNGTTAFEPGSGSTIMAYAGICGADDLQPHSDAYFHTVSFDEIVAYTNSGTGNTCAVITATGNNAPVISALTGGFYIPKSTPFALTGSATDPNGDVLTYCWEEYDLGAAGNPGSPSGDAPILRSFTPVNSATRTFPKLSNLLNNTTTIGEILPTYTRNLKFRLTARDNKTGGGGTDWKQINFAVDGNSGPFTVSSPNTAVTWQGGSTQTITWNAANTTASPVSCANVKISLSTNGGNSFDTVILASTPNDGTESVTIPLMATTQARIKVEAVANIFFDISNVNFTIQTPTVTNPASFTAVSMSATRNDLTFTANASGNTILITYNNTGTFTTPSGAPPAVGNAFAGGTLLYSGTAGNYIHSGLTTGLTYYYKAFSYDGTYYSPGLAVNATPVPLVLNLTAFIEGLYNGLEMVPDTITVEMRNSGSPYTLIESKKILLNSAGQGAVSFNIITKSSPYYIVLKHRNALETWSALSQTFSSANLSYNFTTSQSQAYGSTLKNVSGWWCLYSGDIDQNGYIGIEDLTQVFINIVLGVSGYQPTDINGDLIMNDLDLSPVFLNNISGIELHKPGGTELAAGR